MGGYYDAADDLSDDGYRKIEEREVEPGDVLIYKDDVDEPVHVGLVVEHNPDVSTASWKTRLLSQWGADGEYFHDAEHVAPFLGRPKEFWSERI